MSNVVTVNLGVKKDLVELDLPSIKIASTGQIADVIEVSGIKNGDSITITVRPRKIEDVDYEVIEPLKIALKVISDEQVMAERNGNYDFFTITHE